MGRTSSTGSGVTTPSQIRASHSSPSHSAFPTRLFQPPTRRREELQAWMLQRLLMAKTRSQLLMERPQAWEEAEDELQRHRAAECTAIYSRRRVQIHLQRMHALQAKVERE